MNHQLLWEIFQKEELFKSEENSKDKDVHFNSLNNPDFMCEGDSTYEISSDCLDIQLSLSKWPR